MLGAIAGDIIGSVYEFSPLKGHWSDFPLFQEKSGFTDDTVMTLAFADALLNGRQNLRESLVTHMRAYGKRYPDAGYGGRFALWLMDKKMGPYNSFGNGSAMRVSPAGWIARSLEEAEELAEISAAVTHDHPEGIKGAQAVAGAIYMGRQGKSRNEIRDYISGRFQYDLDRPLEQIRQIYSFDETCQGSVPEAIIAFLESEDFEQAVRKAVWLGGDADTQAAIAGSIAEAFYDGVPTLIGEQALGKLDAALLQGYQNWTSNILA